MICAGEAAIISDMEIIEQLERRIEELLRRKRELELENRQLKAEMEEARRGRDEVLARVNGLLQRIQEEMT